MTVPHAWPWLGAGALLSMLSHGRWTIRVAPWLALAALLHFARVAPPLGGFFWTWLALVVAYGVANRGVMPVRGIRYLAVIGVVAALPALALLADHLLAPRVSGFASTLVLPLAWVAQEFAGSRVSRFGTWGNLAYSQAGDLPLMQLLSVTGLWGISFLIAWSAAVVNWAWDSHFDWTFVGPGVLMLGAVICAVYVAGGVRLLRRPAHEQTVRVAAVGWPDGLLERRTLMRLYAPPLADVDRATLHEGFQRIRERLLDDTRREAQAGAKIVVWPEACALTFAEDEAPFVDRARHLAREEGIHLLMGMCAIRPGPHPLENKAVLIAPSGDIRWSYVKQTATMAEAPVNVRGEAPIPTADSAYGRLASPICFDMDFPRIGRQAGRARADLLLVPASDWVEIGRLHLAMAVFRAVENGAAMVRSTRWGHSAATDPYGRVLAFMDDAATAERAMIAHVPVAAGLPTLYARLGDWLGWLCVAGFLLVLGLAVMR